MVGCQYCIISRKMLKLMLGVARLLNSWRSALVNNMLAGTSCGLFRSSFRLVISFVQAIPASSITRNKYFFMCSEFKFEVEGNGPGGRISSALVALQVPRAQVFFRIGVGQVLVDDPQVAADQRCIYRFNERHAGQCG